MDDLKDKNTNSEILRNETIISPKFSTRSFGFDHRSLQNIKWVDTYRGGNM